MPLLIFGLKGRMGLIDHSGPGVALGVPWGREPFPVRGERRETARRLASSSRQNPGGKNGVN